jgi:hypothetical protein
VTVKGIVLLKVDFLFSQGVCSISFLAAVETQSPGFLLWVSLIQVSFVFVIRQEAQRSVSAPNPAFSERHPESGKMFVFLEKSPLFASSLCKRQGVVAWKMIACHHSKVHPTAGVSAAPTAGIARQGRPLGG